MTKIVVLDGFQEFAQMLSGLLMEDGNEVLTELIPVDFERVINFRPDLIVVALYRMNKAYDRPIERAEDDILGYIPLLSLKNYPSTTLIPLLLVGYGLHERDIPPECCHYDLFLSFPKDIRLFPRKVEELSKQVKSRRKISGYLCPHCESRLTYVARKPDDLFCPRCGTSVAFLDEENCIYSPPGFKGPGRACKVSQLLPSRASPSTLPELTTKPGEGSEEEEAP